jgi:hypothetical protein
MEQEWCGWWKAINPGWWVGNDGVMVQDGDGDLDALRCPGQNGFLNVVVCLKWWFLSMQTPSDAWKDAVQDVIWALAKLNGK